MTYTRISTLACSVCLAFCAGAQEPLNPILFAVATPQRQPIALAIDTTRDISVAIDSASAAVLRQAIGAAGGTLYVRAYQGSKATLTDLTLHPPDQRTNCVRYIYDHRPQVHVDDELTLVGNGPTKSWYASSGGAWQTTHWVLVADDGSLPTGVTWIDKDLVPRYFGGGIEISLSPHNRLPSPDAVAGLVSGGRPSGARNPAGGGTPAGGEVAPVEPVHLPPGVVAMPYDERLPGISAATGQLRITGNAPPGLTAVLPGFLRGKPSRGGHYQFAVASSEGGRPVQFDIEIEDPARYCIKKYRNPTLPASADEPLFITSLEVCGMYLPVLSAGPPNSLAGGS